MKQQTREEPKILAAAERQMQSWSRTAEIEDRAFKAEEIARLADSVQAHLAISREEGAGGSEIAQAIGEKLDWEVLDRNLLDRVADEFRISRTMLELVDEARSNWVYDVLGTWLDRKIISSEKYVTHLIHVVLAAARQGNVVLVGRGAQFLLPRKKGLAVRIIASLDYRIEQVAQREGLDDEVARRFIEEKDVGRRDFVRRYFHHDIDDPHLYDLVVNVERIGRQGAVDQILLAIST